MIAVVDYGMGNLRNVRRAFETIGHSVLVTPDPAVVGKAEKILLPGVGAFGEAVKHIDALGLRETLLLHVRSGRPLLGICLGMQLLFDASEETPGARGLGILHGTVRKFSPGLKIPHIGWNDVVPAASSLLLPSQKVCCYFVHSYYVEETSIATGVTDYGVRFASAVESGGILGLQFHPEKSQEAGLAMLERFARM